MCGIAGIISTRTTCFDPGLVTALSRSLKHRGPDDEGYLLFSQDGVQLGRKWLARSPISGVVLVHRRLSILDLTEGGWQPMSSPDGRYYIVFNGEIYNYLELRQELEVLGHRFRSRSDTEVLLAAYSQWGALALSRLVGMFAFGILDTRKRKIFLARDFFGIKPLYYHFGQDGFAFGSEIKALLTIPGLGRRANPDQLYLYLRYGVTDSSPQTLFAEILQLPPAHYMEVAIDNPTQCQPMCYWKLDPGQRLDLSFEEAAVRLRDLFLESIQIHLRSDVPVGAALSGGIDSSSIILAMRHLLGRRLELHTFSYVAASEAITEERWADVAAQAAGAVAHKVRPKAEEMVADLGQLIYIQDEPFGSSSIYAQNRVFRLARDAGIKVMLDGQGADELLGGYRYYMGARLASLLRQHRWVEAGRFLHRASKWPGTGNVWLLIKCMDFLMPPSLQAPLRRWIGKDLAPSWLNADWFRLRGVAFESLGSTGSNEILRECLLKTLATTTLPHLLRYEDRNSMAYSIESRVPFLTPALAHFMYSLPEEYIIASDGCSKAVFRRAMRGIVPDSILDRKDKIGFATPELDWLTAMGAWVDLIIKSEVAHQIPALNLKEIQRDWDRTAQGRKRFDFRVWRWVNLIQWVRQYDVRVE